MHLHLPGLYTSDQHFLKLCFIPHFTLDDLYTRIPTRKMTEQLENCSCWCSRWWACCMQIGISEFAICQEPHTLLSVLMSFLLPVSFITITTITVLAVLLIILSNVTFSNDIIFVDVHKPWQAFHRHFHTKTEHPHMKLFKDSFDCQWWQIPQTSLV